METEASVPEKEPDGQRGKLKMPLVSKPKLKGVGLRSKIFILFFFIPIILMIVAGLLYLRQLDSLSGLITGESTRVVTGLGEQIIAQKARSAAEQVQLYLHSHPNLRRQDFNSNASFRKLAVQKVGLTGYTALHAVPDENGIWRNWAHVNPKIVGIDMSSLRKPMGNAFPGFWRVFSNGKDGKESKGYYTWQDKDGVFRDKFMVCAPVKETPFYVAATTYLDEFTKPVKQMESRARQMTLNTRYTVFGILGGALVLIAFIVAYYGHSLTGKIKSLTDVAERISVGDLDAEINIKSKDEIGALGEAIARMQDSIRLSIERLRRRR
ncbi:MAG: HAMP domain-containing protein [Desulfobacteraceae bacterium]